MFIKLTKRFLGQSFKMELNWATTRQNVSSGISDQAKHNQRAQPQKLARVLKFRL